MCFIVYIMKIDYNVRKITEAFHSTENYISYYTKLLSKLNFSFLVLKCIILYNVIDAKNMKTACKNFSYLLAGHHAWTIEFRATLRVPLMDYITS